MNSSKDILNNKLQILGKLSASLIHEIRNPVSVIKMNLDYLKKNEKKFSQEIVESIYACSEATRRLISVVDSFSDFSKNHKKVVEYCSVNEISNIAIKILQSKASEVNLQIKTEYKPNLPTITFHKDKLLQVFLNLIGNAIEAGNKKNFILVKTYIKKVNRENKIFWEVEDHGKGIKENQREKIFEDFYTRKNNGTGLGLGVCRKLLNEYNAEIDFKSKPGNGTNFFVKFNPNKK